jgi:hypothetical protein
MNPGLEPERDEAGNPITYAPGFGVPIGSAVRLPSGYTPTGRGDVVGPKGGMYTNTGKTDSSGNAIYSNNGSYYTFDSTSKNGTFSKPRNQIRQNWDREDEENARNNHRKMDPNLIMRKVVLRSGK